MSDPRRLNLPDLPGAKCVEGNSELPSACWDLNASKLAHTAAAFICLNTCPVLAACHAWYSSLNRYQRASGVIAGRLRPGAPERPRSAA